MPELYAQVVFPTPLKQVFTYTIPPAMEGLVLPGMRCAVSFGRRQTLGVIVGTGGSAPAGVKGLKPLDSLLDAVPSLTPDLLELGRWIAEYYYCSLGEALFAILPVGYRKNPKAFLGLSPGASREEVEGILGKIGPLRGVKWKNLQEGKVPLTARTRALAEALRAASLGSLRLEGGLGDLPPRKGKPSPTTVRLPELHDQQKKALEAVTAQLDKGAFHTFLLQGVTGSGKTEVYLRAIARVLEMGKQAIVLIPEIALTPQTVERFTGRFGDRVSVLHSRLAAGERTQEWRRFAEGLSQVAVGARSALFAPAPNLGLIVVDEEHEASYKQEDAPRYHARDAAVKRAQLCGAVALLGSATPSLESVHNAGTGKYSLLSMPRRVNGRPLPEVRAINLREEWSIRSGERPILSLALAEAVRETLAGGEQAILFLNRRGFNTVTLCAKCGEQVHCPSCSIPVTSHRSSKGVKLLCHYCNWSGPVPDKCPQCGDGPIQQVGLGTEKVEEELKACFPKARIGRMDLDTTRKPGSHERILDQFRRGELDLLVGTQMIAKGHDFPGVTLVGIVGADTGLALPDFRAPERVFQLLVQVAGRAGRADKEGTVYLQTFNPDHPSVRAAVRHDLEGFWERELELRKALNYPPYARLGLVLYRAKVEAKARQAAEEAARVLEREGRAMGVELSGPAPSAIARLRGQYRFQILLKCAKPAAIRRLLAVLDAKFETPSGVFRVVDIDPQNML